MVQAPTWFAATALLVALAAPLVWGAAGVFLCHRLMRGLAPLPPVADVVAAVAKPFRRPPDVKKPAGLADRLPARIKP